MCCRRQPQAEPLFWKEEAGGDARPSSSKGRQGYWQERKQKEKEMVNWHSGCLLVEQVKKDLEEEEDEWGLLEKDN